MKVKIVLTLGVIILSMALPVMADMFMPRPYCSKPYKPYEFNSRYELDQFLDEVEDYKQCIADFIEDQHNAIKVHQEAANNAISEWESFVNYELQ